jgi:predicted AAA+ superfamily ATPase
MKRNIYSKLLEWKKDPFRKPLVLEGARQVGKTYILKMFGTSEFKNMVYINCHRNSFITTVFSQDFDVQRIIRGLSAFSSQTITAGETLVFLDEVQESPRVVASMKYFCEDMPQLHIAVAGSLLGLLDHRDESFPVGKVDILKMYPMTFEEFLGGMHKEQMLDLLRSRDWKLIDSLNVQYIEMLRQYYFVGGMPRPVLVYRDTQNLLKVRNEQNEILDAYIRDIPKHAATEVPKIRQVWASVPSQLAKENKKFIFGAVKAGSRAKDLENAIQWLIDAGLVYKVCQNTKPVVPIKFYEDMSAFKLYMLDCGLMGAMTSTPAVNILVGDDIFKEYKGAFTENYVAEQVVEFTDMPIQYYSKENSTLEIDLVAQVSSRVIPIEVKAEVNVKAKSLSNYINKDNKDLNLKGARFSMLPYIDQGWMENVPLYAISTFLRGIQRDVL